ncbi:hypothetical protein ETAE_1830 [Edwardsiella piscicida]|uniref:Uncharacterized protein n=1 Tax=Edwardsiella piscicida TaxID=1263550 RepID=A0AAU8P4S5_EDWPI|nr:hypothetical protein ETAE_1830 [Edwardsiella tarda EIB202]
MPLLQQKLIASKVSATSVFTKVNIYYSGTLHQSSLVY